MPKKGKFLKHEFELKNLSNLGKEEPAKLEEKQKEQYEENKERRRFFAEEKAKAGIKDEKQEEKLKKMRADILGIGKKKKTESKEEIIELTDADMFNVENIEEKPFTELEKNWFKKGEELDEENKLLQQVKKMKPDKKALAINAYTLMATKKEAKILEAEGLDWKEVADSRTNINLLDNRREMIWGKLMNMGYDITRDGWWKKFKIRKSFDPDTLKEFDTLIKQYETTDKAVNKSEKEHIKKFGDKLYKAVPNVKHIVRHTNITSGYDGRGVGIGMKL